MLECHCRDCQRVSGGSYAAVVLMAAASFRLTQGQLRHHFTERTAGGKHRRGFCPDCGSRITGGESDGPSDIVGVLVGGLDDPSWFRPTMDIFTSDAQPWDHMNQALPKFREYPPQTEFRLLPHAQLAVLPGTDHMTLVQRAEWQVS